MAAQSPIRRHLQIAGILTGIGLLVQLATLFWNQASAFLVFAMIGVPFVIAGSAIFLYSVMTRPSE